MLNRIPKNVPSNVKLPALSSTILKNKKASKPISRRSIEKSIIYKDFIVAQIKYGLGRNPRPYLKTKTNCYEKNLFKELIAFALQRCIII